MLCQAAIYEIAIYKKIEIFWIERKATTRDLSSPTQALGDYKSKRG